MIKLFAHLQHYLLSRMLDHNDYKIIIECKDVVARDRLEHAINREFDELRMYPTGRSKPLYGYVLGGMGLELKTRQQK